MVFGVDHIGSYGPFPAPNGGQAFSAIATGDGGPSQGLQYLNVYSDYGNSGAHGSGNFVNALVFQEQTIGAGDVGQTATLSFDYRANPANNNDGATTTFAFIKVIKQSDSSFDELGLIEWDTTVAPDWQTQSINLTIDAGGPMNFSSSAFGVSPPTSTHLADSMTISAFRSEPLRGLQSLLIPMKLGWAL